MKIFHNQFVIQVIENNGKYYAIANKIYDCGCTGSDKNTIYDAILNVIESADSLVNSDEVSDEEWQGYLDYCMEAAGYYWASEQNRAEDPDGYKEWLENLK